MPDGSTVTIPLMERRATVQPTAATDKREIEVVWTTGAQVRRYSWARDEEFDEDLVVTPEALRLDRLNAGAPLLNTHRSADLGDVIGAVVPGSVRIEGGKGYARVQLWERDEVEPIWRDIKAGIIRNVSVGYRVHRFERVAQADRTDGGQRALYRAVDWEPFEISAVAIGADGGATVVAARNAERGGPCSIMDRRKSMEGQTAATERLIPERIRTLALEGDVITDTMLSRCAGALEDLERQAARHQLGDAEIRAGINAAVRASDEVAARDAVRTVVLDALADRDPLQGRTYIPPAYGSGGGGDSLRQAITDAALHRMAPNMHPEPQGAARELVGRTIPEMAEVWCRQAGVSVRGGPAAALRTALELGGQTRRLGGLHGTSDFPEILGNVMHNRVQAEYEAAASAFPIMSMRHDLEDFREHHASRLQGSTALEKVTEAGEVTYTTLDDQGEKWRVETYARAIGLTRQAIINDAEGAFNRLAGIFGNGAAETIRRTFVRLFEANAGAGPTLSDGLPVFHADRNNLMTASGLTVPAITDALTRMRRQTGIGGEPINVMPTFLLVAPEQEGDANKVMSEIYATDADAVNPWSKRLRVMVEVGITDPGQWYVASAPGRPESLVHGFLRGMAGPDIATRTGFEVDGMEMKATLDFGAAFLDWRGWIMNPGAPET